MSEFKPISTQEEFNAAIQERLAREEKKFEGYTSPDELSKLKSEYEAKIKELNDTHASLIAEKDGAIAERDGKIKRYETDSVKTRIAHEMGLPYEAMEYLRGESEEDVRKSAEGLRSIVREKRPEVVPLAQSEPAGSGKSDDTRAAVKRMLDELKGE